MSKHTPGPWRIERCSTLRGWINEITAFITANEEHDGEHVLVAEVEEMIDRGEETANARLIAEAPMMLEALRAALHDLETSQNLFACDNNEGKHLFRLEHQSIATVIKAIAKATGGNA